MTLRQTMPVVIMLAVLSCVDGQATQGQDVAAPFGLGDYPVGYQRMILPGDRFHADVWYPVDAPDAVGDFAAYPFGDDFAIESTVAFGSTVVSAEEHPLVVLYHGAGGGSNNHFAYNELLASHGFIVMAPNLATTSKLTIDAMLTADMDPTSPFFERIDEQKIATAGFSLGGSVAGSIANRDDRVGAMIGMSPSSVSRSSEVPTLFFAGTKDAFQSSVSLEFERMAATPRYLGIIENAVHGSYIDACNWLDYARANDAPDGLITLLESATSRCTPDLIDPAEVIELTAFYSVAFLNSHLLEQPEYETFLTSEFAGASSLPIQMQTIVPEPSAPVLLWPMAAAVAMVLRNRRRAHCAQGFFPGEMVTRRVSEGQCNTSFSLADASGYQSAQLQN